MNKLFTASCCRRLQVTKSAASNSYSNEHCILYSSTQDDASNNSHHATHPKTTLEEMFLNLEWTRQFIYNCNLPATDYKANSIQWRCLSCKTKLLQIIQRLNHARIGHESQKCNKARKAEKRKLHPAPATYPSIHIPVNYWIRQSFPQYNLTLTFATTYYYFLACVWISL
jgi:hypothetical protein